MLNEKQTEALNAVISGENIFLTGAAGTGKSYLIQKMREELPDMAVTASTGIAAIGIDGITIHSFLGLVPEDGFLKVSLNEKKLEIIEETTCLLIDEISMIGNKTLDLIDKTLRDIKDVDEPFGGIQVIFSGDFLQLAPVSKEETYAFNSPIWKELKLKNIRLTENMRQGDTILSAFLNKIRHKKIDHSDFRFFREHCLAKRNLDDYTRLFSTNKEADSLNDKMLDSLPTPKKIFSASGAFYLNAPSDLYNLKKDQMIADQIILKKGAVVMMRSNDFQDRGVANGSIGKVIQFDVDGPLVEFENGEEIIVKPKKYERKQKTIIRDDDGMKITEEVVTIAAITQLPLKLAWAITIHRSQGLTLKKVACDFSRIFANSQGYVALSRATDLDHLYVQNFSTQIFKVDQEAFDFMNSIK